MSLRKRPISLDNSDVRDNATQASYYGSSYSGTTIIGEGSTSGTKSRPPYKVAPTRSFSLQSDEGDKWTGKLDGPSTVPPNKALVHHRPPRTSKREPSPYVPPPYIRPQLGFESTTNFTTRAATPSRSNLSQASDAQSGTDRPVNIKIVNKIGKKRTRSRGRKRSDDGHSSAPAEKNERNGPPPKSRGLVGESPRAVDIVTDPSTAAKDIVVRLQMPVEQDYDDELEVFSRLWRLGRFRDAEEYFQTKLKDLEHIPYVLLQHTEMLLACGNYRGFTDLITQAESSLIIRDSEQRDVQPDKVSMNLELMGLLSQPQSSKYAAGALTTVIDILSKTHLRDGAMGSTDVQMLALCLRVTAWYGGTSFQQFSRIKELVERCCNWKHLYHDLLVDERIWDFGSLFNAAIELFGWQDGVSLFFDGAPTTEALDKMFDDWNSPSYDESLTLGLLDLFTTLYLDDYWGVANGVDARASLLLRHAKTLTRSIQQHDIQMMKTRPFIRFILVNILAEAREGMKKQLADGYVMGGYTAFGTNAVPPVFIPPEHPDQPILWSKFVVPSTKFQRDAVNVALQASIFTGDLNLQATSLQVLIQQSDTAAGALGLLENLSNIQLGEQGDRSGFLTTCLSFKYRALAGTGEEATLLEDLKKLDGFSGGSYLTWGHDSILLWARSMIEGYVEASVAPPDTPVDPTKRCKDELHIYGPRLPEPIVRFLEEKLSVVVPRPPRVSFDPPQESEEPDTGPRNGEEKSSAASMSHSEDVSDWETTGTDDSGSGYSESDDWQTDSDLDINVRRVYNRAARETREQSYAASDSEFSSNRSGEERERNLRRRADLRVERNLTKLRQELRRRRLSLRSTPLRRRLPARRSTSLERDRSYFRAGSSDDYAPARNYFDNPFSPPIPSDHNPFRPLPRTNSLPPPYGHPPPVIPYGIRNANMTPYFPVAGWPPTWQQDAAQMLCPHGHSRNQLPGPWDPSAGDQGYSNYSDIPIGAAQSREEPSLYAGYNQATAEDKPAAQSEAEIDGSEADIERGSQSPRMGIENGLPKLDFPPSLLEDSTLTVFVRNKADPLKARAYRIEQNGVFEAPELVKAGSSVRQPSPQPLFKRRHSQHGTISATPPPQPPNAPHPPRAASKKRSTALHPVDAPVTKAVAAEPENLGKKDKKGKGIDLSKPITEPNPGSKPTQAGPTVVSVDSTGKANHAYVETEGESEEGLSARPAVSTETGANDDGTVVEEVD